MTETEEDYRDWWMAYEPDSPDQTACPRCGCETFFDRGPAQAPFGLGIVVCEDCHKMWTHVRKWLKSGLRSEYEIPDEYQHHIDDGDTPDDLYDADQDSEGWWMP